MSVIITCGGSVSAPSLRAWRCLVALTGFHLHAALSSMWSAPRMSWWPGWSSSTPTPCSLLRCYILSASSKSFGPNVFKKAQRLIWSVKLFSAQPRQHFHLIQWFDCESGICHFCCTAAIFFFFPFFQTTAAWLLCRVFQYNSIHCLGKQEVNNMQLKVVAFTHSNATASSRWK